MGDHTDYNGLPVFPMAIQQQVTMYARRRADATICVANLDPRFEKRSFEIRQTIEPGPPADWGNYVKAAAQALIGRGGEIRGFDALVDSDLPVAAGLSSSSALIVAAALALLESSGLGMDPLELMTILAKGERYVGTEGGGMDQAICLGGRWGTACKIDFDPLRLTATPVPPDWRFVIAPSLVPAEKSGGVRDAYNLRGHQCRESLGLVARALGLAAGATYRNLLKGSSADALVAAARDVLDGPYEARFRHVVTEAERVEAAREAMVAADLVTFGRLMSESHASLRDDFEVSCDALEDLVRIAVDGGAAGARLTGAGFGGCVVALCHERLLESVLERWREAFYRPRAAGPIDLIVARPSDGASVVQL